MKWKRYSEIDGDKEARQRDLVLLFENDQIQFAHCVYVNSFGTVQSLKHDHPVWRKFPGKPTHYLVLPHRPNSRSETEKVKELLKQSLELQAKALEVME